METRGYGAGAAAVDWERRYDFSLPRGQGPVLLASGGEVDKARRFMPWLAGVDAMRPGNTTERVAAAVRGKAAEAGLLDNLFSLFIGHGIGAGANEPPYIGETLPGATAAELRPGMLFALEPLIWVEDGGVGVRIKDMILVTEAAPRVLSRVEYDETLLR